jgi:histone-lysine N-methyltransferase SETMAR
MIAVFFGVETIALLAVLHQGSKVTSAYFWEHILRELAVQKYPRGRKPSSPHHILHFKNMPVHNTEEIKRTHQKCEFLRLEQPPYSPDLSPCDFFFVGDFHGKMKVLSSEIIDKPEEAITKTIEGIPRRILIGVFHAWRRR